MEFKRCLVEPIKRLCVISNEELSFRVAGEIEIEPGKLIKIRFLSEVSIPHERFDKVRIDSMGGSGVLVDVLKNGEVVSALHEYEYVASYGYFSGSSVIGMLDAQRIVRAQVHCSRLHDLRLAPDSEVEIEATNLTFKILPYQIDRFDYSVTSSERLYYIEEKRIVAAPIETILSELDSVRMYVSLLIDNPVNIDELVALVDIPPVGERRAQVYRYYFYFPIFQYGTYEKRNELYNGTHVSELAANIGEGFRKWAVMYARIEQPIRVFYNSLYSGLIIDHKMMNLATFLETFHKKMIGRANLKYRARLVELIRDNTAFLGIEDGQVEALADLIKDQRNIVAHTDAEYRLDQDLYKLVNSLVVLIQAVLLKRVVGDQIEIGPIMESRKQNYFLYTQFGSP